MSAVEWEQMLEVNRETATTLNIGNMGPGASRMGVLEVPIPQDDDQRYDFAMWARNGFVSEVLLMHRNSDRWVWAWRVERTLPEVNKGKASEARRTNPTGFSA